MCPVECDAVAVLFWEGAECFCVEERWWDVAIWVYAVCFDVAIVVFDDVYMECVEWVWCS